MTSKILTAAIAAAALAGAGFASAQSTNDTTRTNSATAPTLAASANKTQGAVGSRPPIDATKDAATMKDRSTDASRMNNSSSDMNRTTDSRDRVNDSNDRAMSGERMPKADRN